MTLGKVNKSKILTLILGLTMSLALMLGIAFASPADTARAAETDTRIVVSKITATSNIDDIIGFGKSVKSPTFNIEEDVPAQFQTQYNWEKKTATSWEDYSGTAFTEGTYRYVTQIRIDSTSGGATTHMLDKNGITVTVNDVKWDNSIPEIYDTYSFAWVSSKEYEVVAPAGTPLDFIKDNNWDINKHYINQAITAFSVADGAAGGTKPYTFSKVSGPEWIAVAADGTVSGTPTVLGANADLVIKVTDSAVPSDSKEITLRVGKTYVLPADREVISVIKATSNIGEILGYGKSVVKPSFTFTEGTQANFPYSMGHWYKKEGTAWKRYEEATFTEGTYMYGNQLRVDDEYGMSHVLNKDGVSVYIDDVLCADNQKPEIYNTYSLIYVDTINYEVKKPTAVAITDELVPVTDLEKVFNAAAQEPTFGGTLVLGADYEVGYTVKAGAGGALDMGGKPVDAGTYVVTVTGKGAYEGSFTKEFVINKAEKSAPVGLFANPISCTDGSGAINGATTAMEYRKVGDADFTACSSSTISGLAAAEYEVRYAEDENYFASDVVTVTVAISHNLGALEEETPATCSATGMKAHYYCSDCRKFFDESKNETTEAALTIAIDPNAHDFGEWIEEVPATCVATGTKGHKDCRICNKHFDESENEITEAALTIPANDNHDWNAWASNLDGTHSRTCKRDGSHKENGNCSGGTATCENKAVCSVCGAEYGEKLGHDYGEVKYTWTGNDACKAERVCKRDSAHIESETATATAEEIKAATCKEKGRMKYTATFENAAFAMQEKEVDIDLVPHSFGDLIDEIPATCVATGMKAHYHCSVCGKFFDESKNETTEAALTIPANDNHDWNAWASNLDGTHTRTCKRDGSHKENGNCSGGTATCENKAVCSVCGAEYGEKLGHDYGEVKYTWTGNDACKAERVCKRDSAHIESETATATAEEIKAATCKEKGRMKYTATFENAAFAMQEKEVDIDLVPHSFGDLIDEIPATCVATGMKAHYHCSVCEKFFDESKNETTEAALTIPANDNHDWNVWSSNGNGTHTRTCKRDGSHKENGNCSGGKATCTTKAVCDVCRTTYGNTAPHNTTKYNGKDSLGHWDTCSTCHNRFNFEKHTPNREKADETNPVKCAKCGFVITAAGHYEHTADSEWHNSADGTYHYHKCTYSGCSEILDKENHSGGTATCENKAVCSVCSAEYGEKLGHNWGEVKYTWTGNDACKAERVCKRDSAHIESETATATAEEIKAATCKEKGRMKYTATFENAAFAMQEKEVDTDLAPHSFGAWADEVPATKETTGTKAHKDCEICGKHFDKDGNEITDLTIEKLPSDVKDSDSGESSGEVIEPEKDKLSGGAIAGIVIGSVAVAGIGGFAIFWFAVKKKSFADLFAAIKALFTKKK